MGDPSRSRPPSSTGALNAITILNVLHGITTRLVLRRWILWPDALESNVGLRPLAAGALLPLHEHQPPSIHQGVEERRSPAHELILVVACAIFTT